MAADRIPQPRLTERQRQVLERIAEGKTNVQIADELGLAFDTVKMHVSNVLAELGVASREEAAAWWRSRGGIAPRGRGLFAALGFAKLASAALLVLALGGTAAIAIALTRPGDGDSKAAPAAVASPVAATSTAPGTTAAASPTPQPIGYQAAAAQLHFSLVRFVSDALHTEVVSPRRSLLMRAQARDDPQIWITDATGYKTWYQADGQIGSGQLVATRAGHFQRAGTVTIEVEPVRDYVVPALNADEPTPDWAKFTVPSGYTSPLRTLSLPQVTVQAFETGAGNAGGSAGDR